jgi:predicted CoA-binding protein
MSTRSRARTKFADSHGMTSPRDDDSADWSAHLLESSDQIRDLLGRTRRIAVLGIKTEAQSFQPAYYVPEYVHSAGNEIVPVPVYYPDVTAILGQPVFRRVADIPGDIVLVNVFRRSQDVPPHVDDILAKRPKAVWMQSGIRHDEVAARLARAGIDVVQDRCLMVEVRRVRR